jgi:IMP dehydrogenase
MAVSDLLKKTARTVVTASADISVQEAIGLMDKEKVGVLIVLHDDRPVGLFSIHDCFQLILDNKPELFGGIALSEAMTSRLITARPGEEADTIRDMMLRADIRYLPVIDDGRLSGVVHIQDLMQEQIQILEDELRRLRDYIDDLHEAARD